MLDHRMQLLSVLAVVCRKRDRCHEEHARHAVCASLQMQTRLQKIANQLQIKIGSFCL